MGSEDLTEYAVVSSRLQLYRVEPVRVVRRCMRVGFPRILQRLICCCTVEGTALVCNQSLTISEYDGERYEV